MWRMSLRMLAVTLVCVSVCAESHDEEVDFSTDTEIDKFYAGHWGNDPFIHVDNYLIELGASVNLPADQMRYMLMMFIAYPLSIAHRFLPDVPALKHLYSLALGGLMSWACFGVNSFVPLALALLVYGMAFVVPRDMFPLISFGVSMGTLSLMHLYRLYIDYGGWALDVTGPLMIVVLKCVSFAWNVKDGKSAPNPKFKRRQEQAVDLKDISLLSYLGYMFYFGGYLAGPTFEFADYLAFTNLSAYKQHGRPSVAASCVAGGKILLQSLCWFAMFQVIKVYLPVEHMFTDSFLAQSVLWRQFYPMLALTACRLKFYFIWLLAEGALVCSGLGYNGVGKDGTVLWDKCVNCKVLEVELAQSPRSVFNNWNISVNTWLRYYVYERAQEAGVSTGLSTLLTFMTSAFWHGFYGGYYVTFFLGGLMTVYGRKMRSALRPYFEDSATAKTPSWYNVSGYLLTMYSVNGCAIPFQLLAVDRSFEVFSRLSFVPAVPGVACIIALQVLSMTKGHRDKVKAFNEAKKAERAAKKK